MGISRLKAQRRSRGLTQAELAEKAGIHASSVSRLENEIERGDRIKCPGHFEAVCDVLDLAPHQAKDGVKVELRIKDDSS